MQVRTTFLQSGVIANQDGGTTDPFHEPEVLIPEVLTGPSRRYGQDQQGSHTAAPSGSFRVTVYAGTGRSPARNASAGRRHLEVRDFQVLVECLADALYTAVTRRVLVRRRSPGRWVAGPGTAAIVRHWPGIPWGLR